MSYELSCDTCSFETVVETDLDEVYDVIEAHLEDCQDDGSEHFVNFEQNE